MDYIRKSFTKELIKEGQLIELTNIDTRVAKLYLVQKACGKKYDKYILVAEHGKSYTIDCLDSNLNIKNHSCKITKVYGDIIWNAISDRYINYSQELTLDVNLFDTSKRTLIYKKDILFMTERQLLEHMAKQLNKDIILIQ